MLSLRKDRQGDVFHDYTMAQLVRASALVLALRTMLRDDRSPGALLTKACEAKEFWHQSGSWAPVD